MSDLDAAVEAAARAIHAACYPGPPECEQWQDFLPDARAAVEAAAPIIAAQALRDAADELRANTCGEDREGITRWPRAAQETYELAIEEARSVLHCEAEHIEAGGDE